MSKRSGARSAYTVALVDNEGYRDGRAIAAIQHDTSHLHVHAVVYENAEAISQFEDMKKRCRETVFFLISCLIGWIAL